MHFGRWCLLWAIPATTNQREDTIGCSYNAKNEVSCRSYINILKRFSYHLFQAEIFIFYGSQIAPVPYCWQTPSSSLFRMTAWAIWRDAGYKSKELWIWSKLGWRLRCPGELSSSRETSFPSHLSGLEPAIWISFHGRQITSGGYFGQELAPSVCSRWWF